MATMRAPIGISLAAQAGRIAVAVPPLVDGNHQRRRRPQVRNHAEDVEADPHVLAAERGLQLALWARRPRRQDRESPACRCRAAMRTARPARPAARAIRRFGQSPSRSAPPAGRARTRRAHTRSSSPSWRRAPRAARPRPPARLRIWNRRTGGSGGFPEWQHRGGNRQPPERLELIDVTESYVSARCHIARHRLALECVARFGNEDPHRCADSACRALCAH